MATGRTGGSVYAQESGPTLAPRNAGRGPKQITNLQPSETAGQALHGIADWIGNPLHPKPIVVTNPDTGRTTTVQGSPILTPFTLGVQTAAQAPDLIKNAHAQAVAVAHAKQPPSLTGDAKLLLSGALGLPRMGVNEETKPHPLTAGKPTIQKGAPPTAKTLSESAADALRAARGQRAQQEVLRSQERAKRLEAYGKAVQANPTEAGHIAAMAELKGKLPALDYSGFKDFSQEAVDHMHRVILDHSSLTEWQKVTTRKALGKIRDGSVPTRGEEKLLRIAFGTDATKQMIQSVSRFRQVKALGYDVANSPRSIMASFDASGALRQGLMIGTGHPRIWAKNIPSYLKAMKSEDFYTAAMDHLHQRPNATNGVYEKMGLDLTELTPRNDAGAREEAFRSPLAEKIPGVRMSSRGFTAFLDSARADLADHLYAKAVQNEGKLVRRVEVIGGKPRVVRRPLDPNDPHLLQSIGDMVNSASGRGDLGTGPIGRSQEGLNLLLFSPRLIKSRIDFLNPVWYAKLDPLARHQAYKAMGGLVVLMATTLGIARAAGAQVNLDPRSSDFAKIKVGNTRIDLAGGFQQYIRLMSEIATQQTVSTTTGKATNLGPEAPGKTSDWDLIFRFLRSKLAPLTSATVDASQQRNTVGQPLSWQNSVISRVTPLSGQDALSVGQEASSHGVLPGVLAGTGAFLLSGFGGGVQNFQAKPPKARRGSSGGSTYDQAPAGGGSVYAQDPGGGGSVYAGP